ncbi:phosphotransferase [uncultured Ferrovibrio sp.]|jgi:aminoglycoside phosphotransferase (APT) family kinase protein|uniref:phosphotransferase n=1 Tax=uncultured Ferrovibrio sp. TaxID=1576913 RepID=UPI0026377866|nr:phosphotransferase [uncultured Ferrovibrio sp.]
MQAAENLTPVQPHHRFDEARLAAYLAKHLPDFKTPLTVQQFKGNAVNPAFLLHSPGRNLVLRKRALPKKGCTMAESIQRDYTLLTALHKAGMPVGMPHLCCLDEDVIGTPFYLLEHVPGRHFRDPNLPGMDPKQRHALYDAMAAALAQVHALDPAITGLPVNGGGRDYLVRQIGMLTEQYRANRTDDIGAVERLLEWLPANVPQEQMTSLMHGNFRLENLIFHASEPRVIAIHDWDLALIGHPLADLAINCMPYRVTIPGMGSLQGIDFIDSGIPGEPDYLAAYCRHSFDANIRDNGIAHWNFYLAFALFRVAVMAQGIVKRGLEKGGAATPTLKAYAAVVRSVANQAWNLVDGGDD